MFVGFPLLLLTSTGAKSGAERLNLIGYFDIDGKTYVVGSAAGRDQSPGWVFNLRADPNVTVEIGSDPAIRLGVHEVNVGRNTAALEPTRYWWIATDRVDLTDERVKK